jgi:hypothetical protein
LVSGKTVVTFMAGAAFAALAIAWWYAATPEANAQEGGTAADSATAESSAANQSLLDALARAGAEIRDPQIKAFYGKLADSYALNEASSNSNDEWVPDISRIQQNALTLPLLETQKGISDPDIAAFYAKFLADSGFGENAR